MVLALAILATRPFAPGPAASPSDSLIVISGSPLLDKPAPPIELKDDSGRTIHLADYRGRPVIVNFWASWCVPCKTEFPLFRQAREAHEKDGLEILGVVFDDTADKARAFMTAEDAAWPMLVDPAKRAAEAYRVSSIPMSFYIDRAGVVRAVSFGPPSTGSLGDLLAKILAR
jgi:cytochrome c biogenesis protein CcmG/thiol:disulfide interchange protein DsbE